MSLAFPRRLPWLLAISAAVIALDRASKLWVSSHIELGQAIPVIPGFFRISHVLNDGAAFSLFADSASPEHVRWALITFSALAVLAVLGTLVYLGRSFSATSISLALILGGAIGNLYDRIRFASVVDFLEVHIIHYHWPDFNIADSAIVTGALQPDQQQQPHQPRHNPLLQHPARAKPNQRDEKHHAEQAAPKSMKPFEPKQGFEFVQPHPVMQQFVLRNRLIQRKNPVPLRGRQRQPGSRSYIQ